MHSTSALERKTSRLVLEARRKLPAEETGFLFDRGLFNAGDWSRLSAFLDSIKQPAGNVLWRDLTTDQLDEVTLWACLQHENSLQHDQHAAIIRQWLDTPWSATVAALLDLANREHGRLENLPYEYAFHFEIQHLSMGYDRTTSSMRRDIRYYLLQREQGVTFVPCIDKRSRA